MLLCIVVKPGAVYGKIIQMKWPSPPGDVVVIYVCYLGWTNTSTILLHIVLYTRLSNFSSTFLSGHAGCAWLMPILGIFRPRRRVCPPSWKFSGPWEKSVLHPEYFQAQEKSLSSILSIPGPGEESVLRPWYCQAPLLLLLFWFKQSDLNNLF